MQEPLLPWNWVAEKRKINNCFVSSKEFSEEKKQRAVSVFTK